ncbi:aminodeoxychorismate synthase component I [Acinetobacter nectaris]|uniref:aminodeoxychorismate synthase component I n=1 Tax=Acinetobacter nectaris TaxID=1219382 RepID=UPI001F01101D|nr:aminodeoxychorismate synthase component I [Acinetobacter nectaris]MCF9000040.1 aminodeoxychorismate synthase component I [Acinetobacter nectaris]MCF9028500.1 aminodeoxychorismate synthase component I [Acinetobacter nectaris]
MQKNLSDLTLSPAQVLQKLQELHGIIYLQDHGKPVITFLPERYWLVQNESHYFKRQNDFSYQSIESQNPLDFIQLQHLPKNMHGFSGGWMGFIGYDYAAQQSVSYPQHSQPAAYLGLYHSYLKYENHQWIFYSTEAQASEIYHLVVKKLTASFSQQIFKLETSCQAEWSKQQYNQNFQKVQEYIRAGDCYQINLTQKFSATAQGKLIATADAFWQLTNAPYAGYLKVDEFELLSCSPELFIEFHNHREIRTRPIKGTMPRFSDQTQDEFSKQKLKDSEKDQAENLMIVDLLRNDLSVYAENGSVKTPKLFEIESFKQVHHMVSEIQATLTAETSPLHMLLTALPGGSITGAPKIRAMEIIEELEQKPRGAYCGSLGYFNLDGTGCWNIMIRSIQKYQDELSIWAGGGITIASEEKAEYQECFDKVDAMLDLINTWYQT